MSKVLKTTIQVRRATEAEWQAHKDTVLAAGEPAMTLDGEFKGQVKYGDGITTWENLPYSGVTTEMDMKDIYFTQDFVFTVPFGKYEPDSSGQVTVPATGLSGIELIENAFSEDRNPSITQPSASVTSAQMKAYEAGTSVTPSYTAALNAGKYEFGPATGISATAWKVQLGEEILSTASGTFKPIQVGDDTNLRITATATHGDGAIPLTALKKEYAAGQIKAGDKAANTGALTGYRQYFYGVDTTSGAIDSSLIRSLTASGRAAAAGTININSKAGATRIIVAVPTASGLKVKNAILTTSMNADITSNYVKQASVQVEGASGYTAVSYDVYVYQPASIDASEVHKVTIGK